MGNEENQIPKSYPLENPYLSLDPITIEGKIARWEVIYRPVTKKGEIKEELHFSHTNYEIANNVYEKHRKKLEEERIHSIRKIKQKTLDTALEEPIVEIIEKEE